MENKNENFGINLFIVLTGLSIVLLLAFPPQTNQNITYKKVKSGSWIRSEKVMPDTTIKDTQYINIKIK